MSQFFKISKFFFLCIENFAKLLPLCSSNSFAEIKFKVPHSAVLQNYHKTVFYNFLHFTVHQKRYFALYMFPKIRLASVMKSELNFLSG